MPSSSGISRIPAANNKAFEVSTRETAFAMLHEILLAVALLLIIEGALPFLSPEGLRKTMAQIARLNDSTLRFAGLTSMVLGCLLLYMIK